MRLPLRRRVYEIRWEDARGVWVVRRRNGRPIGKPHYTKRAAVSAGARRCRRVERLGGRAQLVSHLKDGTYEWERTYPDETPGRKG